MTIVAHLRTDSRIVLHPDSFSAFVGECDEKWNRVFKMESPARLQQIARFHMRIICSSRADKTLNASHRLFADVGKLLNAEASTRADLAVDSMPPDTGSEVLALINHSVELEAEIFLDGPIKSETLGSRLQPKFPGISGLLLGGGQTIEARKGKFAVDDDGVSFCHLYARQF